VHPTHETVLGERCYPTVFDVPGDLDLAVILTGRAVDTFEEVLQRKAAFAVIFAAGFAEAGEDGEKLQARLDELVRDGEVRLLGPNTNLNAFEDFRTDLTGPSIALITQSGHQGRPVFQGQEIGIRLTHWAPTGNEVDLEFADFARYFADQPEVGVIAAYIEGFKDGRTLMLAADHAARLRKPMVIVKVGRTDEGRSMAMAHTGHLTGSDAVTSAVFRQFGVTRAEGLDDLLDTSAAFARTGPSAGGRVGIYAISGGTGAHMADIVSAAGLDIPGLTAETQRALHDGLIPDYLRVSNPVDCGGPPVADARGRRILDLVLADPNVDVLVVPITGAVELFSEPFTRDLVDVAKTTDKPVFVVWGAPAGTDDTFYFRLLDGGLPVFRTFANCVRAVRAHIDYWRFAARYRSPFDDAPTEPSRGAAKAHRLLEGVDPGETLSEHASKQVLKAYGVRSSRDVLCESAAQAVEAAKRIGFPVVMKVSSAALTHKSDLGLVRLGVGSARDVRAAYDELMRKARRAAGKRGHIDGVLVCETVSGGVETVVGVSQDPLFGPVVMVGLGGVFVEVLRDVSFRVPPFDRDEAGRMVRELRGFPLLEGARGRKPVDVGALVDVIMNVQRLAMDLAGDVRELDINPLIVRPRGAVALDALVVRT
jgi:acyl-CoA synthetase (NDP forming)